MIRTPAAIARDLARCTSEDDDVREAVEAQRVAVDEAVEAAGWCGVDAYGASLDVYRVDVLALAMRYEYCKGYSYVSGKVGKTDCYAVAHAMRYRFVDDDDEPSDAGVVLVDHGPGLVFTRRDVAVAVAVGQGPEALSKLMFLCEPNEDAYTIAELVGDYQVPEALRVDALAAVEAFWAKEPVE